jgi:folate-binding Fe-S cluster repair protein YgfZ
MLFYHHSQRLYSTWLKANDELISPKACTLLASRGLIRLAGPLTHKFLQGMLTQHTDLLLTSQGIYGGFLTSTGRILADVFVYRSNLEHEYFLECDSFLLHDLIQHLRKYKLRTQIDIDDVSQFYSLWSVWSDSKMDLISSALGLSDPRCPDMGFRYLIPSGITREVFFGGHMASQFPVVPEQIYHIRRIILGISEGKQEFLVSESFPMEYNMDFMNGSKNRYILIRKIEPFFFFAFK